MGLRMCLNMGRLAVTSLWASAEAFIQEPGGPVWPLSGYQCHFATTHHPLPSWWPRKPSDSRGEPSGLVRRLEGGLGGLTQAWAKNTSQLSWKRNSRFDWRLHESMLDGKFWSHLKHVLGLMNFCPWNQLKTCCIIAERPGSNDEMCPQLQNILFKIWLLTPKLSYSKWLCSCQLLEYLKWHEREQGKTGRKTTGNKNDVLIEKSWMLEVFYRIDSPV